MATNFASASNGSTITMDDSPYSAGGYDGAASNAIDGNRLFSGASWDGTGGGHILHTGTVNRAATIEVNFNQSRTITEIDIFTPRDSFSDKSAPTLTETFTQYGITAFTIKYWNGSSWTTITSVTGNNKVWRQFTFLAVTTTKIQIYVSGWSASYVRVMEIEAWGVAPLAFVTTSPLPNATAGSSYSQTIQTSGGDGAYDFDLLDDGGTLGNLDASGVFTFSPTSAMSGTTKTIQVSVSRGSETVTRNFAIAIYAEMPLALGFDRRGLELLAVPNEQSPANNSNAMSLNDLTANGRNLTATSGYPTFQTNVQNGKAIVRFSGSNNPLKNSASFKVACGWIVFKHTGATFGTYEGILTGLNNVGILVGNGGGTTTLFNFLDEYYEYRLNDRIYPKENAPAPMGVFKIGFFRLWNPVTIDGVQIGQDRADTSRKFTGDIALLALSSNSFCEEDVRAQSQRIADYFALTLADVFPFNADKDSTFRDTQSANIDFPPSGGMIAETLGSPKVEFDLKFSWRDNSETKQARAFLKSHYAQSSFIYRSFKFIPPFDTEGYATSLITDVSGEAAQNDLSYAFGFREK